MERFLQEDPLSVRVSPAYVRRSARATCEERSHRIPVLRREVDLVRDGQIPESHDARADPGCGRGSETLSQGKSGTTLVDLVRPRPGAPDRRSPCPESPSEESVAVVRSEVGGLASRPGAKALSRAGASGPAPCRTGRAALKGQSSSRSRTHDRARGRGTASDSDSRLRLTQAQDWV